MHRKLCLLLVLVSCLISQGPANPQLSATYTRGTLHLTIPYDAPRAGNGKLIAEALDPEDHVLGRVERAADAGGGKGSWQAEITLANPPALDDLVWDRVHYRFAYAGAGDAIAEDTESISQILRMPVLRIIGQQTYFEGGDAAVRILVTDSKNQPVSGPSQVRIEIAPPNEKPRTLFAGALNARGTTQAQFKMPAGLAGSFPVHYVADTPIGSAEFTQTVRIEEAASILLTTEKPIYQPGQTVHVRALELEKANHQAGANRPLTFEIQDSRGNKVFRKATQTDRFGVASADFTLADEVNLGAYHLRAGTEQIAFNVDRYVLPKFKVALELSGAAAKHGYRPGDHVTGTVRANYFFGKPVDHAEVSIRAIGTDVTRFEGAPVSGKTDESGAWRFDVPLPDYFAGKPLAHGAARVLLEATVKDGAGHEETRGEGITVSESPLLITAVPEGGLLVPGIENQVYLLTSYADGAPAAADLTVSAPGQPEQRVATDSGGVAVVNVSPAAGAQSLSIEARDHDGNRATSTALLDARSGSAQVLLRANRAIYHAGEGIALKIFSTKRSGAAYIDAIRDGQTMLTRDVDLVNGQAELTLPVSPDMAGTLDLDAYIIGGDSRPVADHRLVFVQPADDLKIETTVSAASYRPGEDARVRFHVTNSRGEGVQAALGVQVVDEAVFALAEKQPGFAKVFFYLEEEAMKPRYEIHSIGMPQIVEPVALAQADRRDRAARALFAATELVTKNAVDREAGREIPRAKFSEYRARYEKRFDLQVQAVCDALNKARAIHSADDVPQAIAKLSLRDSWGSEFKAEKVSWQQNTYILRSAGPDKQLNTGDDFSTYLEFRSGDVSKAPPRMLRGVLSPSPVTMFAMVAPRGGGGVGSGKGGGVGMGSAGGVLGGVMSGSPGGTSGARVRSFFPEALYINPEIVTDASGSATISIPLADSITTWRMALVASTARGALGSGTSSIKVFQDFFTDLDLPVTLTQGDRVSIPVAVYNYSPARGDVSLRMQTGDWFTMAGDSARTDSRGGSGTRRRRAVHHRG